MAFGFPIRSAQGRAGISAGLVALLLAACSGSGTDKVTSSFTCPQVRFLREAVRVTQFVPGAPRTVANVVSEGELADFKGGCVYDSDGVEVNVDLAVVAAKGPAMRETKATYRYFVAVVAPDQQVLAREEFSTTVEFSASASRGGNQEELRQQIPLGSGVDAGNYTVVIGFQLSPEEYEFNRALLERRQEPVPVRR
jgi:hypothetical protein